MITYYYDCEGPHDKWKSRQFKTNQEAIAWFDKIKCKEHKCVLYDEDFKVIKEC